MLTRNCKSLFPPTTPSSMQPMSPSEESDPSLWEARHSLGSQSEHYLEIRKPVDVIATYINTADNRVIKADLLRAHACFTAPSPSMGKSTPGRFRSSSGMSKDASSSTDWGWFADIDSSNESWGADNSLHSLRHKFNAEMSGEENSDVVCDEQRNSRNIAAHKTFATETKGKVVAAAISIPKFRIVQSRSGADRHAEYLITFKLGKEFYADWRRYSEFGELVKQLDSVQYKRTLSAWKSIETRWFNRLEPSYLHHKCITLENFIRELMYELKEPDILMDFLGGASGKVNVRPTNPQAFRPAAQLPKELRPPQPPHERELFEKMWEENFKRSRVNYSQYVMT